MGINLNIHQIGEIKLGAIGNISFNDVSQYFRNITLIDKDGKEIISICAYSDNGYNLLIDDAEIAALNEPVLNVV